MIFGLLLIGLFFIAFFSCLNILSSSGFSIPSSVSVSLYDQTKALLLYLATLEFFLAASGVFFAEKCLKVSVTISGALLIADFFTSLCGLAPFGDAADLIVWFFFCSISWFGLLKWMPAPEIYYENPLTYAYDDFLEHASVVIGSMDIWYLIVTSSASLFFTACMANEFWSWMDICMACLVMFTAVGLSKLTNSEFTIEELHHPISSNGQEAERSPALPGSSYDEWTESKEEIVIDIPSTLKTITKLIGIACFFLLLAFNRSGIPTWFRNDLMIGFAASILIRFFIKCQYLINFADRAIHQEFTNPIYYKKRRIGFDEIAMVTTIGKLSGWPLLWHLYKLDYSVALILKDGVILPLPRKAVDKTDGFSIQAEASAQAEHLARFIGCEFQPGLFFKDQNFSSWCSYTDKIVESLGSQTALKEALWQAKLSNVSLEFSESGLVKVDLPTMKEKFVLFLLTLLSIISTYWIINSEASYIAANPRLIYLFLLDSTSVLMTLYAAWLWLIDEYYIFDMKQRLVLFRSRFLFWRKETSICSFDQIDCFEVWKRHSLISKVFVKEQNNPFTCITQFFVRLKSRDGKYYSMSDCIHGNDHIPTLRGGALNKLVFSYDSPSDAISETSSSLSETYSARSTKNLKTSLNQDHHKYKKGTKNKKT